ncbi:hypothetical protein LB438_08080 [Lactococcus lactis subsp. lactis]
MTIVASNSLTVSNVYDGTITHTAYANSADGTDGFTTVYPNLNLLKNTIITQESLTPKNWSASVGSLLSVGSNNGIKVVNNGGIIGSTGGFGYGPTVNVKAGDTITVSYYVKNTGAAEIKNFSLQIAFYGSSNTYPGNNKLVIPNDGKPYFFSFTTTVPNGASTARPRWFDRATAVNEQHIFEVYGMKTEQGSTATPHMPSASEVTTADWPSYIGQYTDFTQADSTNPSDYTWSLIRGNDGKDGIDGHDGRAGKDGNGIKTTVITYAISSSGTVTPTTGWTSQVPTLVKEQYLWTKTVWTYTDNTSETGYSVSYIAKDGNNGHDGFPGKDGTGIKTTTITYAGSTSGTIAPNTGWTSTVPTVAEGSYLWTKTVWTYTDNSFETGYSVGKMGNTGPAGSNGNPGKVVSDTEPTTKFKGLTWKYSGVVDMTLGDGTKILAGTEYYWNGTVWALYEINAHNINGDNLSVTNGTFKDGKIESVWGGNGVKGTTTIEGKHLQIHSTNSVTNTENTVALDNEQGYAQVYVDKKTGRTITVQVSSQGFFVSDSTGPYVRLTPQGLIQTSKKATVNFGYGRNVTLTRNGSYVTITSQNRYTIKPANNTWIRNVATLPLGYRPVEDVLIYNHDLSNSSKFSWSLLHPSGVIDLFSIGNITTTDYILSSSQIWITNDELPS